MKKDWTYKKLGEVGTVVTGSTPSTKDNMNYSSQDVCFFKPSDLSSDALVKLSKSEFYISKHAFEHSRKLPKGSVLTTCIGIIGKVGILTEEATCNQQINAIIPNPDIITSNFLGYSIMSKKHVLQAIANAPVVPLLNKTQFSNFSIPIPPLSIQHSIVSELDLLHSVIEKKQEQLRALDNLAQSLFYQMFGDPITNPMGWEIKKLGEVGIFERGKGISKNDFVEDGAPCVHYGQLHTAFGAYTTKHLSCISESLIDNPRIAHTGDVLLALTSEDVEGSCKSTAWLGDYDIIVGSDAAVYHHTQDGMYISFYTRTEAFYKQKEKYAHGFKVTHISTKDIETFIIPLPPLSLQQSFAAKVSAIEAQKQAITQSIKDVESLLAQRMDHYFG